MDSAAGRGNACNSAHGAEPLLPFSRLPHDLDQSASAAVVV
jgi:hypothetical protein